eukprot:7490063-Pyramimonas_sp.AAC.1
MPVSPIFVQASELQLYADALPCTGLYDWLKYQHTNITSVVFVTALTSGRSGWRACKERSLVCVQPRLPCASSCWPEGSTRPPTSASAPKKGSRRCQYDVPATRVDVLHLSRLTSYCTHFPQPPLSVDEELPLLEAELDRAQRGYVRIPIAFVVRRVTCPFTTG